MKKSILQLCLTILLSANLTAIAGSLTDGNYKKMYRIAEDNFLNENYIAALSFYLKLDSLQKGNANVNFKIGYCYLNAGGFKTLSIPYFVEAAKNVSKNYNKYSTKEVRAPQSTYSYLARAYQLDYKFDEAIAMYEKYKTMLGTNSNLANEIEDINHDIETCKNGKEMYAHPAHYTVTNLGAAVNSPYPDYSPVVSLEEQTLMFTSRRPEGTGGKKELNGQYFEDIYISYF